MRGPARLGLAFVLGLLLGGVLGAAFGTPFLPAAARVERVLVDARLPLRGEGVVIPFTVDAGATVRMEVHLPEMLEGEAQVGPLYLAMRPDPVLEPEPREDHAWSLTGCETPARTQTFAKAGTYAIRIPSIPTAMGMEDKMWVTARIVQVDG